MRQEMEAMRQEMEAMKYERLHYGSIKESLETVLKLEEENKALSSQVKKQATTPEGVIFQQKYEELKSIQDELTNTVKQK